MYSVIVPGADAASHVGRHDVSFARHWVRTQVATERHAGSFGQLDEPWQQLISTHDRHDDVVVVVELLKISLAPGQLPPSVAVDPLSVSAVPPSPTALLPPPPVTAPEQGTPLTAMQLPSCGGVGPLDDEHAASPSPATHVTAASRPRRARDARGQADPRSAPDKTESESGSKVVR
jgi:hypothetical protein